MPSFEQSSGEIATPTSHPQGNAEDFDTESSAPIPVQEASSDSARMLELAAVTADQLVNDARTEAESLVATAQATAEQIGEAARNEAAAVAGELSRTKADLEAQIATLRQIETEQRSQMRRLLTEQLSLLDAARFEPPAGGTG